MKNILLLCILLASSYSFADVKVKMNFKNEEIENIIRQYSVASGQKFIVDSTVRGKITILNPTEISTAEAFEQLSEALAVNGFGIVKNGEWFTIKTARSIQRDNVSVSSELPSLKPQRMATWIVTLKNITANEALTDLRILASRDGELSTVSKTNQIIITDWTSNLQRVAEILKQVDGAAEKRK